MSTTLDNIIGLSERSVLTAVPLPYAQSKYRGGKRSKEAKSDYIMAALDSIGRHYGNSPADSNDNLGGKLKGDPAKSYQLNRKELKMRGHHFSFKNRCYRLKN